MKSFITKFSFKASPDAIAQSPSLWIAAAPLDYDGIIAGGADAITPLYLIVPQPKDALINMARFLDPYHSLAQSSADSPYVAITVPILGRTMATGRPANVSLSKRLLDLTGPLVPREAPTGAWTAVDDISPHLTEKSRRIITKSTRVCLGFMADSVHDEDMVVEALERLYPYASGAKQSMAYRMQSVYYQKIIDECYKKQLSK